MNTKQIIAELRRSACEDKNPFKCFIDAFQAAYCLTQNDDWQIFSDYYTIRTFYLLVAEAMEST